MAQPFNDGGRVCCNVRIIPPSNKLRHVRFVCPMLFDAPVDELILSSKPINGRE
jgi:hypothetical protein